MESIYFINLIFVLVLNVVFFFSGVSLNIVVIISLWRCGQLRKKLCYFMIMVLSCFDVFALLTNNSTLAVISLLWLTGLLDTNSTWPHVALKATNIFLAFSLFALLVMNFDRYLATSYPMFHRTSVTKGRLLAFLAMLILLEVSLSMITISRFVRFHQLVVLIIFLLLFLPTLFINCKLFLVVTKSRRNNRISPETKKPHSLKKISSCLLALACLVVLSTPAFVYIGLKTSGPKTIALDAANLAGIWAKTTASMNCTFNCLIFYWKNKALRIEGLKVVRSVKGYMCRSN